MLCYGAYKSIEGEICAVQNVGTKNPKSSILGRPKTARPSVDAGNACLKRDGAKETFDRQKVMNGLLRATVKRDIPIHVLETLLDSIETELRDNGITEVTSEEIGNMVLKRLLDIDKVAYVRFASVYRDFKDVEEFSDELRRLAL